LEKASGRIFQKMRFYREEFGLILAKVIIPDVIYALLWINQLNPQKKPESVQDSVVESQMRTL